MTQTIAFTQQHGIATLRLNRPEVRNALNANMIQTLTEKLYTLQNDESIKMVVLRGEGKDFCAGADIGWMKNAVHFSRAENLNDAQTLAKLFYTLDHFPKPTIALVNGAVFGGALGLIACCDLVLAETETTFCFSEVKLGLIPAIVSPYVLRAMGQRAVTRYMLTAEPFSAQRAAELQLVHEVVEAAHLEKRLQYFLDKLQENGPNALKATKQLLHSLMENQRNPVSLMEFTSEFIADVRTSAEAQEGLNAFLNKRQPQWQNRDLKQNASS